MFGGHFQKLISRGQQFFVAEAREVLQLQVEPGRVAQFIDGRWIERENNRVFDRGKLRSRARDHRLNGVFGTFALAPIFEPSERKRGVLPASIETKTGDGD